MCIFLKRLNHDSGQNFQIFFEPTVLCRFMMLVSQKEAFWTIKMSFYYSPKLTHDSCQKFQISSSLSFCKRDLGIVVS